MFLSNGQYLNQARQLVENSQQLAIAIAFWGEGSEACLTHGKVRTFAFFVTLLAEAQIHS